MSISSLRLPNTPTIIAKAMIRLSTTPVIQHSRKKRWPLTQEDSSAPVAESTQLQVLMAPMDAAVKCIVSLEKTLRWPGQAYAYREIGTSFMRLFSKHYHEDQKIMTAKAVGDYKLQTQRL